MPSIRKTTQNREAAADIESMPSQEKSLLIRREDGDSRNVVILTQRESPCAIDKWVPVVGEPEQPAASRRRG